MLQPTIHQASVLPFSLQALKNNHPPLNINLFREILGEFVSSQTIDKWQVHNFKDGFHSGSPGTSAPEPATQEFLPSWTTGASVSVTL